MNHSGGQEAEHPDIARRLRILEARLAELGSVNTGLQLGNRTTFSFANACPPASFRPAPPPASGGFFSNPATSTFVCTTPLPTPHETAHELRQWRAQMSEQNEKIIALLTKLVERQ